MTTVARQSQFVESAAKNTAVTGEQLLEMGDIGRVELIKGELIQRLPTRKIYGQIHGYVHAYFEILIAALLFNFVREHNLGRVLGGEAGIYTKRDPDTVRGVDIAFISNERMSQAESSNFLDVAPELIVEITSPSDRWIDIQEKLVEYFNIGVELVWLVDPQLEQIHVYRSLDDVTRLTAENTLTAPNLLPGFSIPLTEIFEATD